MPKVQGPIGINYGLELVGTLKLFVHLQVKHNPSLIQRRCSASKVLSLESGREVKMGFIMEFAENLILRLMEDPKERDRKFRERLYERKERCNKTKEMWSYPLRPYGFWTFERHNAQLRWDAQISQVQGRRDPYDDLLQDSYDTTSTTK